MRSTTARRRTVTRRSTSRSAATGGFTTTWTAVTKHATPWIAMAELPAFADDVWELYAPSDWTQADDLAGRMPDKLRELQGLFLVCLLYTSPSPRDGLLSRMPSSA